MNRNTRHVYTVVLTEGEEIFNPIVCLNIDEAIKTRKKVFTRHCSVKNIKLNNMNKYDDFETVVWANSIERVRCYIFESDVIR